MFSGGLDSTLATKIVMNQGVEVVALHLTSPFCTCDRGSSGCKAASVMMAEQLGVRMVTVVKGKEYYRLIRNPKFGYGSAMNPCIDCRIFGLKKAKELMEAEGARFIVTGEVLGQRPMSQRRDAIRLIEREAGLEGLILRPLSAQHFPPTIPEKEGWVDREKLLSISGRSRKKQMELAEKFDLKNYPCPAGGCLLTDKGFARRVKDLLDHKEDPDTPDFNLLKIGRHLRLPTGEKLIVPRNEAENRRIEFLGRGRLVLARPDGFPGPIVGIDDFNSRLPLEAVEMAFRRYSKKKEGPVPLVLQFPDGETRQVVLGGSSVERENIEKFLVV
ncbi:MAG: hypothetical protein D6713_02045 [Deltaproteobacteria bacterium]|nr:MAG: hypothetical protein D6713_02045 [Deltaproteobacteria bacterium]